MHAMPLNPTSCDLLRSSHGQGIRIVSYASTFAHLQFRRSSFGKGSARLCLAVACISTIIRLLAKCLYDC
jgi:hypothetical protein